MDSSSNYVKWFRHSSPYIHHHRDKTMVMMLTGEAAASDNFANIIHDIALLNGLGVKLVLVHGARPQIDQRLQAAGKEVRLHHDQRITSPDLMGDVIDAVANVRTEFEARLSMSLANTPMHGAKIRVVSGNFVMAKPLGVLDGVDMGLTGELRRVDSEAIQQQLALENIVLVTNLGYSPTGEIFNLSVEEVAVNVASALNADKLVLFGAQQGIRDSQGELRSELLASTAKRLVSHYLANIDDPTQPHSEIACLLGAAANACERGVPRCHLVSYQEDGALLTELFTRDGYGTMVSRHSYEQVREASIDDVGGLIDLIAPLEQAGVLVRRSRELLESEIERFSVIERDNAIIGCAALYPFHNEHVGELAGIAVSDEYRGGERGDSLLEHITERAKAIGLNELFVLTTRTAHWFLERGFVERDLSALPSERQALYNFQRNSKVFFKVLE